tara:strand:+ start:5823 stop:6296 length:474 start_codon:yes stop_codon:yes gene_type:complete
MIQRQCYVELTHVAESIRHLLKRHFSIHAMVQVRDHSIEQHPPDILLLAPSTAVAVQFQLESQRGFVCFPMGLASWLQSELLGTHPPNQPSLFSEFLIQLLVEDCFCEMIDDPQFVDLNGLWIHPEFDVFIPMAISIYKTPQQCEDITVFFPRLEAI